MHSEKTSIACIHLFFFYSWLVVHRSIEGQLNPRERRVLEAISEVARICYSIIIIGPVSDQQEMTPASFTTKMTHDDHHDQNT